MKYLYGITSKVFDGFYVFRGYAEASYIAQISEPSSAYQRNLNDEHIVAIAKYIEHDKRMNRKTTKNLSFIYDKNIPIIKIKTIAIIFSIS